jgi:EamA domain-containing membrane protein RarD
VANPVVGVLLGILLFDERLSRPVWHVVVAVIGLALALGGAVLVSLVSQAGPEPRDAAEPSAALA